MRLVNGQIIKHSVTGNRYKIVDNDALMKLPDGRWISAIAYTQMVTGRMFVRSADEMQNGKFKSVLNFSIVK